MKNASFFHSCHAKCAAIALGALTLLPAARAENAPRIDALKVAKIAADYLLTRGKDAPHVVSIVLEQDSLLRGTSSWVVSWSRPMMLEGDKEIGMRIRLDGSVTHIVENKSGPTKRRAPVKF